jgi:hypothetical protein
MQSKQQHQRILRKRAGEESQITDAVSSSLSRQMATQNNQHIMQHR